MCYWKKDSVLPLKEETDVLDDLLLEKVLFVNELKCKKCLPRVLNNVL